jgi:hypothetical protein
MKESLVSFLIRFFLVTKITLLSISHHSKTLTSTKRLSLSKQLFRESADGFKYGGSFWLARCTQPISLFPKTLVTIKGRDNITLLVEPNYPFLPAASLEKRS